MISRSTIRIKHRVPDYAIILREAREKRGMKQSTLAKRLGISSMGLSHWERGTRMPNIEKMDEWAKEVGLEVVITIQKK